MPLANQPTGSNENSTRVVCEITREEMEIVVASLKMGPNLYHLNNYWNNVSGSECVANKSPLEQLPSDVRLKRDLSR